MKSRILLSLAAALVASTIAVAADQAPSSQKRELIAAKNRATARALGNKGALRAHYDFERLRLGRLINALERGEKVNPAEIDRELDRSSGLNR